MRLLLLALVLVAGPALAQTSEGQRGSTPPGSARDGSRPAEGAIKGGAILPGERGGMPEARPGTERCRELEGMLREQCLRDLRNAGAGGTRPEVSPTVRDPATSPPPQNPR
jgi:hypothetical protein